MASFWDGMARKYSAQPISNQAAYEQTLAGVRSYLTATSRVLELGCGTGSTVLKMAPWCGTIVGTDFSGEMIKIAKEKKAAAAAGQDGDKGDTNAHDAANASFYVADACEGLEAAGDKASFDVVMAFNVLYLLDDQRAALAHAAAMVRPGGLFISKNLVLDGGGALSSIKWRVLQAVLPVVSLTGLTPRHIKFQTSAQLEQDIKDAGFELVESVSPPNDNDRRYIVAQKTSGAAETGE